MRRYALLSRIFIILFCKVPVKCYCLDIFVTRLSHKKYISPVFRDAEIVETSDIYTCTTEGSIVHVHMFQYMGTLNLLSDLSSCCTFVPDLLVSEHETVSIMKTQIIRRYRAKCSRLGDMAPGICASMNLRLVSSTARITQSVLRVATGSGFEPR